MTATDDVVKKMEKWREHEPPLHEESLTFIERVFKMSSKSVNELTEDEFRKHIDDVFAHFFSRMSMMVPFRICQYLLMIVKV